MNKSVLFLVISSLLISPAFSQDTASQNSMDAFKFRNQQYIEKMNQVCANDAYKSYFSKTPCIDTKITIEELSNVSKVTELDKKII